MSVPGRRALFFAFPYACFVLLLAGAEAAARAALPHVASLDFLVASPQQQAQFVDAHHVRIFEGDPLLFWRLRPGLREVVWDRTPVTTNAQGLRYARPVGRKRRGTFRIVCAGDSVTFGFRVPFVYERGEVEYDRDWLPYPARLERALRAANPGREIEVIPLAVPGYSSHQGLAWLRRDVAWLEPDVVTLLYGWNDIGLRGVSDADTMKTDAWDVTGRTVIGDSQALIWLWRLAHAPAGRGDAAASEPRVSVERFVANHLEMARVCRARGADVAVIAPVYRDPVEYPSEALRIARYRSALAAAAQRAAIPFLEIPALTESGYPENKALFLEHIHPNHRGHRLLAESLLAFLQREHMLHDLATPVAADAIQ